MQSINRLAFIMLIARSRMLGVAALVVIATTFSSSPVARGQNARERYPAPGGMEVLPGYQHARLAGMDTRLGRIWKENGPEIAYEIGSNATDEGDLYKRAGKAVWQRTMKRPNGRIEFVMTDQETLYVSFPGGFGYFRARGLTTKSDLADVLAMIMTYDPIAGFKEEPW